MDRKFPKFLQGINIHIEKAKQDKPKENLANIHHN